MEKRTGIKIPPSFDAERCVSLRVASRKGGFLSMEDIEFCEAISQEYPEWFSYSEEMVNQKSFIKNI